MAKIADLKNWDKNPREINPDAFRALKQYIQKWGLLSPLLVDGRDSKTVLGGNMRLKALRELGIEEVDVKILDIKSDDEALEVALIDNNQFGTYIKDQLVDLIKDTNIVLDDFKIDLKPVSLTDLLPQPEVKEDDFDPDSVEENIHNVQLGDIWQLGEHRLMCGDSTKKEDVEKLMNGQKADLAHNDPPYGMKKEADGVLNDNLNYDDLLHFNRNWIDLQFTHIKDNGSFYCWGIDEPLMDIYSNIIKPYIKKQKATFRNLITWDKGNGQGQLSEGFRMYPIADEKCLFVMCGVQGFNNNADNYFEGWEEIRQYFETEIKKIGKTDKQIANDLGYKDGRTINHWWAKSQWNFPPEENYKKLQSYCQQNNIDAFKKEYDKLKKDYYSTRAYFDNTHDNQNNVWNFIRAGNQEREGTGEHATPKPIALCERVIKSSCPQNGLVIDYFGGSGSTLIACEQTNRKCYMMELDPHYCSVIIERWQKLTNQKGVKLEQVDQQ